MKLFRYMISVYKTWIQLIWGIHTALVYSCGSQFAVVHCISFIKKLKIQELNEFQEKVDVLFRNNLDL